MSAMFATSILEKDTARSPFYTVKKEAVYSVETFVII